MRTKTKILVLTIVGLVFASKGIFADDPHKFALVLGGAGDPPGATTIFDRSIATLGSKLTEAHYESEVSFDGGHESTMAVAKKNFGQSPTDFTLANAQNLIQGFESKIGKQIKPGDQILILIDGHGFPPFTQGQEVHSIFADGNRAFDVSELKKLLSLTKQNHIKLAVVDASCYSGQTLKLAQTEPGLCVITAASDETVGDASFLNSFSSLLKKNMSLEDTFLQARQSTAFQFPQISTPQGHAAYAALKALEDTVSTTSMDFQNRQIMANSNHIYSANTSVSFYQCKTSVDTLQIPLLMKIAHKALGVDPFLQNALMEALTKYTDARNEWIDELNYGDKTVTVSGRPYTYKSLVQLDANLQDLKRFIHTPGLAVETAKRIQQTIDLAPELHKIRENLLQTDPMFRKLVDGQSPISVGSVVQTTNDKKLYLAAYKVKEIESQIYDTIYKNAGQNGPRIGSNGKGSNPCRDFKF